jgi:hypothetical protein
MENPFNVIQKALVADNAASAARQQEAVQGVRLAGEQEDRAERRRQIAIAEQQMAAATQLAQATVVAVNSEYRAAVDTKDLAGQLVTSYDGLQQLTGLFADRSKPEEMAANVVKHDIVLRDPFLTGAAQAYRTQLLAPVSIPGAGEIIKGETDPVTGKPAREKLNIRISDIPAHMSNEAVREYVKNESTPETLVRLQAQFPDKVYYNQQTGDLLGPAAVQASKESLAGVSAAAASGGVTAKFMEQRARDIALASNVQENRLAWAEKAAPIVGPVASQVFATSDYTQSLAGAAALDLVARFSPVEEGEPAAATAARGADFARLVKLSETDPDVINLFPNSKGITFDDALEQAQASSATLQSLRQIAPGVAAGKRSLASENPEAFRKLAETAAVAVASAGSEGPAAAAAFQSGVLSVPSAVLNKWLADSNATPQAIAGTIAARSVIATAGGPGYMQHLNTAFPSVADELLYTQNLARVAQGRALIPPEALVHYDAVGTGVGVTPEAAAGLAVTMVQLGAAPGFTLDEGKILVGSNTWDAPAVASMTALVNTYQAERTAAGESAGSVTLAGTWNKMMATRQRETAQVDVIQSIQGTLALRGLLPDPTNRAIANETLGSTSADAGLVDTGGDLLPGQRTSRSLFDQPLPSARVADPKVVSALSHLVSKGYNPAVILNAYAKEGASGDMQSAITQQLAVIVHNQAQARGVNEAADALALIPEGTTGPVDLPIPIAYPSGDVDVQIRTFNSRAQAAEYVDLQADGLRATTRQGHRYDRLPGSSEPQISSVSDLLNRRGRATAQQLGFAGGTDAYNKVADLQARIDLAKGLLLPQIEAGLSLEALAKQEPAVSDFLSRTRRYIPQGSLSPTGASLVASGPVGRTGLQDVRDPTSPWGKLTKWASPAKYEAALIARDVGIMEAEIRRLVTVTRAQLTDNRNFGSAEAALTFDSNSTEFQSSLGQMLGVKPPPVMPILITPEVP